MKKRLCFAVLAAGLLVAADRQPVAAGFGIGADVNYWEMDAGDFKKDMDNLARQAKAFGDGFSGKIEQGVLSPELKVFYEHPLKDDWSIGASLGFGVPAGVKYAMAYTDKLFPAASWTMKWEGTAWNVPFLLYAARRTEKLAWFGGLGVNYHVMDTRGSINYSSGGEWFVSEKTKFIPQAALGGEYFVGENFSLGLNLKYLFAGKVEDFRGSTSSLGKSKLIMDKDAYGEYITIIPASQALTGSQRPFGYDMSGLRIAVAAKYYFGGR
ncbi:MAG: hypothetical protein FD189_389 [Elusimicrobia bacterium]|nr:MAG: hypothetical protein FD154_469 [Elusimicrobiota bacterium]KAF0157868.1 MAG: hypothetical protein FD189_389 [Elusimicrobiota bacterium]